MTPEARKERLLLAFRAQRSRRSLLGLTRATVQNYQVAWFHRLLAKKFEEVSERVRAKDSPKLAITLPPRHGKSCLAERLAAWHLAHDSSARVVFTSYNAELASDRSTETRKCFTSKPYQTAYPHLSLDPETRQKIHWKVQDSQGWGGGSVYGVGVRGGITGKGVDLLIIDDPLKGWKDATSAAAKRESWEQYQADISTRLQPGAGQILIQTRWAADDLWGRIMQVQGDAWEVIHIPAIATEDDEYRKKGEALHPERYPLEFLEAQRALMGPRKFNALYQGSPIAEEVSIWRRSAFGLYTEPPGPRDIVSCITSTDATFGGKSSQASWTTSQCWAKTKHGDFYLIDEVRGRWSFPEMLANLKRFIERHRHIAKRHLIEKAAYGGAILETLKREIPGMYAVRPDGSKIARAEAVSPLIERGCVYLPQRARWLTDFLDECAAFPTGAANDRVDAASQGLRYLNKDRKLVVFSI